MLDRGNGSRPSEHVSVSAAFALHPKTRIAAPPGNPLVRKLERITALPNEGRQAAANLPMTVRSFLPHQDIALAGDCLSHCCLIVEGWTCRYQLLSEGRRQITAFNIEGDMPDLHGLHVPVIDHGLAALTASSVAFIPHKDMRVFMDCFPGIAAALWREVFAEIAALRSWIVGIGSRSALERTAHLLCETYLRLYAAGLADDYRCGIPITQVELADALGLSGVHVNRTLQELRSRGLITFRNRQLIIHDWNALTTVAEYDPLCLR